jgi:hypothetical protein
MDKCALEIVVLSIGRKALTASKEKPIYAYKSNEGVGGLK